MVVNIDYIKLLMSKLCILEFMHLEIESKIKAADMIVSAAGKKVVRCKMVKNNAVFVDVGISRDTHGKLTGDLNWELDFNNFNEVVSYFGRVSPVPGGVGPMTIVSLMLNTLLSKNMSILSLGTCSFFESIGLSL